MSGLDPIRLDKVSFQGRVLYFRTPLILQPKWDETKDYLEVENEDYSLFVYAPNRYLLEKELAEEFVMLWEVYVMDDGKKLTPRAQRLKQTLQENLYFAQDKSDAFPYLHIFPRQAKGGTRNE
jgi:hypothetical protein